MLEKYVDDNKEMLIFVLCEKMVGTSAFGHSEHFIEVTVTDRKADVGEIIPVYLDSTDGVTCTGHSL